MKANGSFDEMYNSLPRVELASAIVQQQTDFQDLLQSIGNDLIAHGCQDTLGVRLLHKHNDIDADDLMIEISELVDGLQALSTIKTKISSSGSSFMPNVWLCEMNGDITPLEYTDASCVNINKQFFIENRELFKIIAQKLSGHKLDGMLGLTIIEKANFVFDNITHAAVEYSDIERDANIIVPRRRDELDKSRLIETTWDFSTNTMASCTPSCYSYCVMYSPGHAIEHYSQHIFDDDSP